MGITEINISVFWLSASGVFIAQYIRQHPYHENADK